jgi:Endonuclease I
VRSAIIATISALLLAGALGIHPLAPVAAAATLIAPRGPQFFPSNARIEDIRGNFARAIFYMHKEYGLPIDATMLPILIKWNRQDLVNQTERRRNDKIEQLQGTRNPFIDDPNLVRFEFPEQFR